MQYHQTSQSNIVNKVILSILYLSRLISLISLKINHAIPIIYLTWISNFSVGIMAEWKMASFVFRKAPNFCSPPSDANTITVLFLSRLSCIRKFPPSFLLEYITRSARGTVMGLYSLLLLPIIAAVDFGFGKACCNKILLHCCSVIAIYSNFNFSVVVQWQ